MDHQFQTVIYSCKVLSIQCNITHTGTVSDKKEISEKHVATKSSKVMVPSLNFLFLKGGRGGGANIKLENVLEG